MVGVGDGVVVGFRCVVVEVGWVLGGRKPKICFVLIYLDRLLTKSHSLG